VSEILKEAGSKKLLFFLCWSVMFQFDDCNLVYLNGNSVRHCVHFMYLYSTVL